MIIYQKQREDLKYVYEQAQWKVLLHPEAFFLLAFERRVIYRARLQREEPGCDIQPGVSVPAFQHGACFQH